MRSLFILFLSFTCEMNERTALFLSFTMSNTMIRKVINQYINLKKSKYTNFKRWNSILFTEKGKIMLYKKKYNINFHNT
jgi:hypothetical protein